ncbi:hypothetical protein cyc_04763 [Cyclospora cayetanensis]|uniref:Uncharacterized protein n=1 Tax=Cyclospora cayetanensis TaxID=88456 RepID=A0A1D3CY00_9EIME|nr:hypothetical protein cyc_04763 [Cyclospora cayetanensis]
MADGATGSHAVCGVVVALGTWGDFLPLFAVAAHTALLISKKRALGAFQALGHSKGPPTCELKQHVGAEGTHDARKPPPVLIVATHECWVRQLCSEAALRGLAVASPWDASTPEAATTATGSAEAASPAGGSGGAVLRCSKGDVSLTSVGGGLPLWLLPLPSSPVRQEVTQSRAPAEFFDRLFTQHPELPYLLQAAEQRQGDASQRKGEEGDLEEWALRHTSRLISKADIQEWTWRLCLCDSGAFREKCLGLPPSPFERASTGNSTASDTGEEEALTLPRAAPIICLYSPKLFSEAASALPPFAAAVGSASVPWRELSKLQEAWYAQHEREMQRQAPPLHRVRLFGKGGSPVSPTELLLTLKELQELLQLFTAAHKPQQQQKASFVGSAKSSKNGSMPPPPFRSSEPLMLCRFLGVLPCLRCLIALFAATVRLLNHKIVVVASSAAFCPCNATPGRPPESEIQKGLKALAAAAIAAQVMVILTPISLADLLPPPQCSQGTAAAKEGSVRGVLQSSPRASFASPVCIVSHGSAGSAATFCHVSGIPHLLLPLLFDQQQVAKCMQRAGLGAVASEDLLDALTAIRSQEATAQQREMQSPTQRHHVEGKWITHVLPIFLSYGRMTGPENFPDGLRRS